MTPLSRRGFICGCLVCGTLQAAGAQPVPGSAGCFLNAPAQSRKLDEFISRGIGRQDFASTTGDPDFDRQFGRAIIRLAGFFGERPAFGIVNDEHHDNAWAMPQTPPGAEFGTVGFGSTMLAKLRDFDPSGMAIMAIVAHEFAHVAQYRRGAIAELNRGQQNVRRSELHADYLTGCYLGWIKRNQPLVSVRLAGQFMEAIGDTNVASENHHGTHAERIASVETGFALAKAEDLAFEEYFDRGKAYILRTF
ncbi:MAG TPA: hypothetical protein PKV67_02050 [Hyphomonas sp.]|nr:hypothetical protein [Hyphomonas sp.]HRI99533.1 hypothetical protein [Hyphomonas sp.]HRK67128.1 hypothetical protein [Hyphomonas sp.]